jgi:hypothetical protein
MVRSRKMRWVRHVAWKGEKRNVYRILAGKPEGKRPLEDQDVVGWTISTFFLVVVQN